MKYDDLLEKDFGELYNKLSLQEEKEQHENYYNYQEQRKNGKQIPSPIIKNGTYKMIEEPFESYEDKVNRILKQNSIGSIAANIVEMNNAKDNERDDR